MGLNRQIFWVVGTAASVLAAVALAGCQSSSVSTATLVASQSSLDYGGLQSTTWMKHVSAAGAAPRSWNQLPLESNAIYDHEQWRSPTGNSGVGIVYVHLPFPITSATLLWLAEQNFTSRLGQDGQLLDRWTDIVGRSWFTARNSRLQICGYVITDGARAWIVYYGYKSTGELHPAEMSVAARSVQSIVPMTQVHDPAGPDLTEVPRPHLAATE